MDEKLNCYINEPGFTPPVVSEIKITAVLHQRRKKTSVILFALAGSLWALAFYVFAFRVGMEHQAAGYAMFLVMTIAYMCAGAFAGLILHIRKVGL
jgi:hypothetical protein